MITITIFSVFKLFALLWLHEMKEENVKMKWILLYRD